MFQPSYTPTMKRIGLTTFSIAILLGTISFFTPCLSDLNAQSGYPVIDTTNLVAYYDFLGSFRDSTGNNVTAVPNNAEITEDRYCHPQNAVYLSSIESYLKVEDHPTLDFTDVFSISFWIYLDSVPETETRIISKSDPADPDSGSYWISVHPGPDEGSGTPWSFSFTDGEGAIQTFRCEWGMITGHWVNYTVTYDGSRVTLWLAIEPCAEFETGVSSIQPNDDPLWFGNSAGSGITGKMDDILLYNRLITIDEIENLGTLSLFIADFDNVLFEPAIGDTIELFSTASGPNVQFQFFKGEEVIQDGTDSTCIVVIESESDFGMYSCRSYTCTDESTKHFNLKSCVLYDDIYIYDVTSPEIYAAEGDEVSLLFYVSHNLIGLEYEMYHNGILLPDVRNHYTISQATAADTGAYYLVVFNGCERIVSDTVFIIMDGHSYVDYEVVGWDWTGNISGAGTSYFSSIATSHDGSFCLLGHYGGGLKVEDTEVFSSIADDIFVVKYGEDGDFQWSKFLQSTSHKGKGDLAVDSEGYVYVTGSFWDSIQIEDTVLNTNMVAGSGYMIKYDPAGKQIWIKELETTRGVSCDNIEIDSLNRIYLAGNFSGSLTIDTMEVTGNWNEYANVMFIAQLDTAGSCQWISHAVTDEFMDLFGLIDMDLSKSGEVVASGTYTGQVEFGNGVTLNTPIEGPFLVKFDEKGVAKWGTTTATEFGFAEAFDVSVDDVDRIFLTGMHLGEITFGEFSAGNTGMVMEEIFLARFDSAGICTALNSYGSLGEGGDFGVCYEPATDTTGYLMGMFGDTLIMGLDTLIAGPVSGGGGAVSPNMFIAKVTDKGEPLILKSAGVIGNNFFGEIQVTAEGRLYFAGLNAGISVKKESASETGSVAFVGYLEQGFLERVVRTEVVINEQETICLGDSTLFRSSWYKDAGIYQIRVKSTDGIDTIFNLELTTEICVSTEDKLTTGIYMIYPNPANQALFVKSPNEEPFELQMYGMSGTLVLKLVGQNAYELNVQEYQPGLYLLKLSRPGVFSIHKVLIE